MSRRGVDAACALALFAGAAALAFWTEAQFRQSGLRPDFYQREFAPAVMLACGRGFHNVDRSADQALAAFLLQTRDTLACGEIRPGLVESPLDSFQGGILYLEWAVALMWRLGGVSWAAVSWLNALLAGLFGALVFAVMRIGMRPFAAVVVATAVVTSPLHLSFVAQLRDYAKAPFLLALVLLMGIIVTRVLSRGQLVRLSLLAGVVAAVGFGFRTDLLIGAAAYLATLFVFRAAPSMRARVRDGAAAAAVFIASFAAMAAPMLSGYAKGGAIGHFALLGFGGSFSPGLGVDAKHYELYVPYNDLFQEAVVFSYVSRVSGDPRTFEVGSPEYARASSRYLLRVIRAFPADAAIRAVAAVVQLLNAPFSGRYTRMTDWVHSPFMRRMYDGRAGAFERAGVLGWAASAAVFAGVAFSNPRHAAFLAFIVVFLAGGAAIQFGARHFFYLEFMSWWAIGVMVDRAVTAGRRIPEIVRMGEWRTRESLARVGAGTARSAAVVAAVVITTTVVLGATRRDQQQSMHRLFERILAADRQPLSIAIVPDAVDTVMMTVDLPELDLNPASWQSHGVGTAYLLVDVNPQRCDTVSFSARLRYQASSSVTDFTSRVTVPLIDPQAGSSVKILLPVYAAWSTDVGLQRSTFSGIELPARSASCIASISKVTGLGSFPVLVTAILGPDWRTARHYQTMIGVESRQDGALWHEQVYPTLETLAVGRSVIARPTTDFWPDAIISSRTAVRVPPSGTVVAGRPETPFVYFVQSKERAISQGRCAVARGALTAGGLTFGLLRNGQWYQQVSIVERGGFVAVGCVHDAGTYSIVLANDNPRGGETRAQLTGIGWVLSTGTADRD
jgi:hypothetical protein